MSSEPETENDESAAVSVPPHRADPTLRHADDDTYDAFRRFEDRGFQEETPPEHLAVQRVVTDPARFFGFAVGERWVSTFGSFARELTVPGGAAIAVSAVTSVSVHSAYRRRGLLRQAMRHEFELCRERGETIAALYASESGIYGRFGYGNAASEAKLTGRMEALGLRADVALALEAAGGSVDEVPRESFLDLVRELHDGLRAGRPGSLDRPDGWWDVKLSDPPAWRDGATALRFVVSYDAAGRVDGQASYQFKGGYADGNPAGEVRIREVEGASAVATARLWRYLAGLDLARTFTLARTSLRPPLHQLVADARTIATRPQDALYLRLLDIGAALSARRYAADIDTVIEVADPMLPEVSGRYALLGSPEGAAAARTDRAPELTISMRDLASAYLGETSLAALHAAGLVAEQRPGAVARAAAAFWWPVAPFCADLF